MIKLPYGYGINADNNSYILGKVTKDKNGKEYLSQCCYPSSIESALKILLKYKKLELVQNNICTDLKTCIEEFEKLNKEFEVLLKELVKGE